MTCLTISKRSRYGAKIKLFRINPVSLGKFRSLTFAEFPEQNEGEFHASGAHGIEEKRFSP